MMHRFLVLLLAASVAGSLGGCGREGHAGVRAGVKQLASISAEGALMADDLARGRTKTTFVRVHGAELSAQAEHEVEKLSDAPVASSSRHAIEAAIKLSSDISGAIDELRVSPRDRGQARQDATKLRHWADKASALADQL